MPHSPLAHTADTGLEATASSLEDLISELATGMFELMAEVEDCTDGRSVETTVEAESTEDLVVDTLSELLYLSETEDLHFCQFAVTLTGENMVTVRATGLSTKNVGMTGPPIKAVTYHQLDVSGTSDGWSATVYFDV